MNKTRLIVLLVIAAFIALFVLLDASKQSSKSEKKTKPPNASSATSSSSQTASSSGQSSLVSSNRNKQSPSNYKDKQSLQLAVSQFQRQGPKLDFIQRQNKAASLFRAAKRLRLFSHEELNSLELQLSSVVYHDDSETLQAVMAAMRQRQAQDGPHGQAPRPNSSTDAQ